MVTRNINFENINKQAKKIFVCPWPLNHDFMFQIILIQHPYLLKCFVQVEKKPLIAKSAEGVIEG